MTDARVVKPPVPQLPAIVIAVSVTTLLVLGLVALFPAPLAAVPAAPATAASASTTAQATDETETDPGLDFLAGPGESVTVTRIIDGDTFAVGRRTIQVLGIEACPASTNGGRQATEFAHNSLMDGQQVVLRRVPGVSKDSAGRELRVVEEQNHGFDYAQSIVAFKHTRAKKGAPGPAAYLKTIDAADDDRDCSLPRDEPATEPTTSARTAAPAYDDTDVYVSGGSDHGMPDGALTGGYCRRKWWC